jgi:hypothetical protein
MLNGESFVDHAREQLRAARIDPHHSPLGHGRTLYTPDG